MCGIVVEHDGAQVLSIKPDRDDVLSRGHICPKAVALKDVHEDPDRLRQPVRRTADGWQKISWDEAFDEVAGRLVGIQSKHGRDAVATYFGNPLVHSYGALLGGTLFVRALRTHNRFSATSVDQLPHHFVAYFMYGHQLLIPIPDLDRTRFLLAIGANPVASNGSLMTAPDVAHRLKAIRRRGGRLVVIDPRHSETAKLADTHLFIRPATDALLLLALLQVIFAERLARPGRLESISTGWAEIRRLAAAWPPERVAGACGIDSDDIRQLARDFAGADAAVCYGRMGASTQRYGALTQWLIQVLNIATGNLDRPGGAMLTRPAYDIVGLATSLGQRGHFDRRRTRVRGLPEFGGEFPVAALAEEILTPGEGQVRALVTAAGNPVISTPNGRRLEGALERLDYMVSVDFYVNETTRHANLILPPTFALERDHYDLVFHALAIRNTARYCEPLFGASPDARSDWEIFSELRRRIEALVPERRGSLRARLMSRVLTPKNQLRLGLRFGPYGKRWNPFSPGLTLPRLTRQPHGMDIGPLEPCLPERLATHDKRIALAPEALMRDVARLETGFARTGQDAPPKELLLIGRRDLRSNNSWMHNSRRLVKGPVRCTLLIHPSDAAERALTTGALALVRSRSGAIEIPTEISEDVMPGVVSIPHGWGHHRPGIRLRIASEHAGVSINDLTDQDALDELCGNATFGGVPVVVSTAARQPDLAHA